MRDRECHWKGLLEMPESGSIQYPVTYQMSPATVVTGWIVKSIIVAVVLLVTALDGSIDGVIFAAIAWAVMAAGALFGGGRIEVRKDGIRSRNILTERWYPWAAIAGFETTARVTVLHADGGRSNCWAVQRGNLELDTDRESRVDLVAAELDVFRRDFSIESSVHVSPVAKFVRLTPWEWIQAIFLVPAVVGIGMLINWA